MSSITGTSMTTANRKPRYMDLRGSVFGHLRVTGAEPTRDKHGAPMWLCRCECGAELRVRGQSLRTGHTTSCGCARRSRARADIAGKRFGRLRVVGDAHVEIRGGQCMWRVQCDCGSPERLMSPSALNGTRSCGCAAKRESLRPDVRGVIRWLRRLGRPARYWEFERQGYGWFLFDRQRPVVLRYVEGRGWGLI